MTRFLIFSSIGLASTATLILGQVGQAAQIQAASVSYPQPNAQITHRSSTVAQASTAQVPVQVETVRLEIVANQLVLTLPTSQDIQLQPVQFQDGKRLIVDIPNAQLAEDPFRQAAPTPEIAAIEIVQFNENTIRITATGVETAPTATARSDSQGLVLSLTGVHSDNTAAALSPPVESDPETLLPADNAIRIIVTGEPETYRVSESSVGTRTDTNIRDVPQSIQVIPEQVLEDQGIQEIGDALRNVSGVIQAERASTPLPGISAIIRGFETNNVLRNGLRDTNARFATAEDNIAQIEILKGPASVLFGQGNLGGTINLVTELPLDDPAYQLEYSSGQFALNRFAVDFSSPFSADSSAGYRFNASYEFAGSFREFEDTEFLFVAPTVQLIDTENTSLVVDVEYLKFQSRETAPELPAFGTVLDNPNGEVEFDVNLGEPSLTSGEDLISRLGYRFQHRFNQNWTFRNEFLMSSRESEGIGVTPSENRETDDRLNPGSRTINRFLTINPSRQTSYTLNTNLGGRFNTGSIEHNILFGVELLSDNLEDRVLIQQLAPIDIFDPEYDPDNTSNPQLFQDQDNRTTSLGFYLQNQIYFLDNLILLVGGRFDIANQDNQDLIEERLSFTREDRAFSPRVGLVYQPIEPISLYASYTESFVPVNGREISVDENNFAIFGEPFVPERGKQYEVGIKADITDDISATLALYQLERRNVAAQGDNSPLAQVQVGEQRSRGVELDLAGEILPGWQVIASYAYTDARITEDEVLETGNRLPNVPQHAGNLWTSYQIQSGALEGLGFGIGLLLQSEREVGLQNFFSLPGYLRTDAALFYRRDRLQASINIQNLFDVEYYSAGRDYVRIIPGQPFTIVGKISWEF
jgi:iron complex outermembrane receptor protein